MVFSSFLASTPTPACSPRLLCDLGITPGAFIAQLVSFALVVLILGYFGFPVIQRMLEKRRAIIQEGVENAEKAKRELAEAMATAEEMLRKASIEGQARIEQATKMAEKEAQRLQEEAQARAAQFEQQQAARIQQEVARARAELSRLAVNLSLHAAGKVIGKSVDTKDNRRLVEEFVATSEKGR